MIYLFFFRGGCPGTPTPTPTDFDLKLLRGHEGVRGEHDGYVNEGGGGWVAVRRWEHLSRDYSPRHCHCLAQLLPLNFTDLWPRTINKAQTKSKEMTIQNSSSSLPLWTLWFEMQYWMAESMSVRNEKQSENWDLYWMHSLFVDLR